MYQCYVWWKKKSCFSRKNKLTFSLSTECDEVQKFFKKFQKEFPEVILLKKSDVWWWRLLYFLLKVFSFGRIDFTESMTTTFKNKIYLSNICTRILNSKNPDVQLLGICTLRHEVVHLKQFRTWGTFKFLFYYSWPPFFKTRRATLVELPAYLESMRALFEYFGKGSIGDHYIEKLVSIFTGPEYLWMFTDRKLVKSWFEGFRKGLENENNRSCS